MTDWRQTLAICRRELKQGRCCLGLNAKAHGWCSVDRHADKWIECGMEPPETRGESTDMDESKNREPTRQEVLDAFRRRFDRHEFPKRATDAEIAAILTPRSPVDGGSSGPGRLAEHCKMTKAVWKYWASWMEICPQIKEKPVLSGKRAFVKAAREAFDIGAPLPAPRESLPLVTVFAGDDDGSPWTEAELASASRIGEKFRAGVAFFVEVGDELERTKEPMPHGRWMRFVEDCLPMSIRTTGQLMRIANDPNIRRYAVTANCTPAYNLPPDRTILDEICGLGAGEFDELAESGVIHAEMKRGDLKRHLVAREHAPPAGEQPPALPDGKYGAILADPPWPFQARSDGGKGRSAENHYPTMSVAEICGLPVRDLAADDAALFLWTTSEHLAFAPALIEEWGFVPVSTAFVWVKGGAPGLGYWTRKGAEICLLGTRGSPKRLNADVAEVIHAPRGPHSQKPEEAYERIERLVAGPYLELFGRGRRYDGWDVWGNDPALRDEAAE